MKDADRVFEMVRVLVVLVVVRWRPACAAVGSLLLNDKILPP
jgi:hypothetical protein